MRIVLDTNVLVSGLLSPFGVCGEIVRMLTSGTFALCVDSRILLEYKEVVRRPKFQIDRSLVEIVLEYIESTAEIYPTVPLKHSLPHEDDAPFLEVALASRADFLVSGNLKHFPAQCRDGISVLSPQQFIQQFRHR